MTKLSEVEYVRPDLELLKEQVTAELTNFQNAGGFASAKLAVEKINGYFSDVISYQELASFRYTIDTRDEFYSQENDFWNTNFPHVEDLQTAFASAVLASPFRDDLVADGTILEPFVLMAQNKVKTFKQELIPAYQKESILNTEYNKLIASAEIEFQGELLNLSQLGKYSVDTDQEVRQAAAQARTAWFVEHETDFDRIYDELVKLRTKIAHESGFANFAEMSFANRDRFGYDQEMINDYRAAIKQYVTPAVTRFYQRQAKRFGKDRLDYFDLGLEFPTGNATPKGTPAELVAKANQMYHEMSPETGRFFDFMVNNETMDLVTKKGKEGGGYCEFIPKWHAPIIFANFNGTMGDVDVLTHEAGHAFQTYMAQWIKMPDMQFPTTEAAEFFSMSMEFMAYPWMKLFFEEQTPKYKFSHLAGTMTFLPYGVLVDHFQYEVYTHPEMTPEERKSTWRRLEQEYQPYKDYSADPDLERGTWWYRQGHIFDVPFYYIDYTIAQVVAQQFWKRREVEHDEAAWSDYLAMAKAGGSKTMMELLQIGHLASPFEGDTLKEITADIETQLNSVSEDELK